MDKPIIFSAPMIRALLDGRKTQTRRILKPQPDHLQVYEWRGKVIHDSEYRHWCWKGHVGADNWDDITTQLRPFLPYAIGDRLWVKETFTSYGRAKDKSLYGVDFEGFNKPEREWDWSSSRFMPRWASRLTLTVTDVRVQRLQDISEADALAEGILTWTSGGVPDQFSWAEFHQDDILHDTPVKAFEHLWGHVHGISGPAAWHKTPWVVALTFTVRKGNIDAP